MGLAEKGIIGSLIGFAIFIGGPYFWPDHPQFHESPLFAFVLTAGSLLGAGYLWGRWRCP